MRWTSCFQPSRGHGAHRQLHSILSPLRELHSRVFCPLKHLPRPQPGFHLEIKGFRLKSKDCHHFECPPNIWGTRSIILFVLSHHLSDSSSSSCWLGGHSIWVLPHWPLSTLVGPKTSPGQSRKRPPKVCAPPCIDSRHPPTALPADPPHS